MEDQVSGLPRHGRDAKTLSFRTCELMLSNAQFCWSMPCGELANGCANGPLDVAAILTYV